MSINRNSSYFNQNEFGEAYSKIANNDACIYHLMTNSNFVVNTAIKMTKSAITFSHRIWQTIRNPFLLSQSKNFKKLSYYDIGTGIQLCQAYLQFKMLKAQNCVTAELKQIFIDHIKEKNIADRGLEWLTKGMPLDEGLPKIKGQFSYKDLLENPAFQKTLLLAANPKWGMLIKHRELGFHLAAPLEWQVCVHALLDFVYKAMKNQVDEKCFIEIIDAFANVLLNYKPSDNLEFLLYFFPEIIDVMKLILDEPKSIALLVPLLFGGQAKDSFCHYIQNNHINVESKKNLQMAFLGWLELKPHLATKSVNEIQGLTHHDRFERGRKKLELVQQELLIANTTLQIGIVMEYDQESTTFDWLKTVLDEKIDALASEYGDLTQIGWKIFLVDARASESKILTSEINNYIKACSSQYQNITLQHVSGLQIQGKAEAVKYGLSELNAKHDIVGFVDLSSKINILEVSHLITSIYDQGKKGHEGVAIGSRRMAESQVVDKAFTLSLRSAGLNWIVKGLFPLLYEITDSQAGFKFFSKTAWKNIQKAGLQSNSLAFDIEILQQAARLGFEIKQFPIDFHDNTQGKEGEVEAGKIMEMLSEILQIRASHADTSLNSFEVGEGRLLAGGAEHMVFRLEDNTLVKIPHEYFDPHFFGLLKHVIFKNRAKMKWEDQDKKLISADWLKTILDHPKLNQYIPLLRANKELNIFVMKIITNIENKSYQSTGYEVSEKLGRDLVMPFCFVHEPFSLKLEGKWRTFSISDQVKRTVSANKIVKDHVFHILANELLSEIEKEEKILILIDETIQLFKSLWKRGLFDLDANIMNDMGYYPDTKGIERLMVLDPGEMLNDPSKIDLKITRQQMTQRYDFKELKVLLKPFGARGEAILANYQLKMGHFFDFIEEDLKKEQELRQFGEDQKLKGFNFSLVMPVMAALPAVQKPDFQQTQTIEYFERSKSQFHLPYSRGIPILHSGMQPSYPFLCSIPCGINTHPRSSLERLLITEKGSIGPILHSLDQYDAGWLNPKTDSKLIILDAGSATRSSLLKYATERGTKGDLRLKDKSIYEHIAANFSQLLSSWLPEGYVVIASSDDLVDLNEADCQAIYDYFHPINHIEGPGFYWTELPNNEKKYLPHSILDTIKMLKEPAILQLSEIFFKQVPFFKGAVEAGHVKPILHGLSYALEKFVPTILRTSVLFDENNIGASFRSVQPKILEVYQQLVQYQAAERLNGIKTPFLMIFKKEFLADFKREVLPFLPETVYHDITWESVLVRGIKMDKTIWRHSGKPAAISFEAWDNLWDVIQKLKIRYHIDVDCPEQGAVRSVKLAWQNFDDPYSLFLFAKQTYQVSRTDGSFKDGNNIELTCDQTSGNFAEKIDSSLQGSVVALNSKIEGKVIITAKQKNPKKSKCFNSLFYNVQVPAESVLYILPNHVVVGIDGQIFSMKMGMISKEKLKTLPVYKYDEDGHPTFFSSYIDFNK